MNDRATLPSSTYDRPLISFTAVPQEVRDIVYKYTIGTVKLRICTRERCFPTILPAGGPEEVQQYKSIRSLLLANKRVHADTVGYLEKSEAYLHYAFRSFKRSFYLSKLFPRVSHRCIGQGDRHSRPTFLSSIRTIWLVVDFHNKRRERSLQATILLALQFFDKARKVNLLHDLLYVYLSPWVLGKRFHNMGPDQIISELKEESARKLQEAVRPVADCFQVLDENCAPFKGKQDLINKRSDNKQLRDGENPTVRVYLLCPRYWRYLMRIPSPYDYVKADEEQQVIVYDWFTGATLGTQVFTEAYA